MPPKKTINLAIPEPLLTEFNDVCKHYGHAKQKGLVLSAAMLMFLEADPEAQGKALERILIADVRSGIETMIARARQEQARRVAERDCQETSEASHAPEAAQDDSPLARAARRAGDSRRSVKELPELPEHDTSQHDDESQ